MFDMVIQNANIVFPDEGIRKGSIGVDDGVISAISANSPLKGKTIVDAEGKYLFPGVIEAHSHLGLARGAEDFDTETSSAAAGGVTTILFFLRHPESYDDLFAYVTTEGNTRSFTDYGFHIVLLTEEHLQSVPRYVEEFGVTSFKLYQTYRGKDARMANFGGKSVSFNGIDDGYLLDCFKAVAAYPKALAIVHAENVEIINREKAKMRNAGRDDMRAFSDSRPVFAEVDGIRKTLSLASEARCKTLILHLTSRRGLDEINNFKKQYKDVFIEVCHPYLTLNEEIALTSRKYKMRPPLRPQSDIDALWSGVFSGAVNHIGSDHVPRKMSEKMDDMWNLAAGASGTPYLLPVVLTEGHFKRGLPLENAAALLSKNPAKMYGLYPKKGGILLGSDADFVLVDLDKEYELKRADLEQYSDYILYEGMKVRGFPEVTILRGRIIAKSGKPVVASAGWGRYEYRFPE
jgi:dihydropyrimidinase